jgi:hypothetical protein
MRLETKSKQGCIFGLPDSGKSTLANWLLSQYGTHALVFDTLNEFPDTPFDRYVPANRGNVAEFENVIRRVMATRQYDLFAVDESNRYMPSKPAPLPAAAQDLNDWRAHYGLGTLYLCRRPVQLNQDVTELSNYLILFKLDGKNDIDYLNGYCRGLGDATERLKPYHFIVYVKGQGFTLHKPIPSGFATSKQITRTS